MTVTVAISTRDRPEALGRCLAELMRGNVVPDEIVVVDQSRDGRTRETVEAARRSGAPVVYRSEPRGGLGVAQNAGFELAGSDLVAVTDDDCVPAPDWLGVVVDVLTSEDAPDALTGRVLPYGDELPGTYAVASRTSAAQRDFVGKQPPWDVGSGNNFALSKAWFGRIGGCDERLGPGAPGQGALDMDLFYRLLRAGARIRYEPEALVYHERTTRAGRLSRRYPYGFGMGAATVFWLRRGDRYALRVLVRWIAMRASLLGRSLARGRLGSLHEELLVLRGTVGGLLHGIRATRGGRNGTDER